MLDASADPLVFVFQRDQAGTHPAPIAISRHAWQLLGPTQAVDYVVDRYLLEHPAEPERVGRGLVHFCVRYALERGGAAPGPVAA
ncbi:hypothetical protein SAMN06265337_4176 [Hymenobacter gelipurpurascens]|uniref:Uncharacterized protein n=1 Tax=Hymenobacter gelipurpurascens TaxID=89968 RepID=A0A212UHN8_9BACT|nr:hypothetical protein SAMN06265337_4176 [Hymenobacter gelipurpurascens]